MSPAHKAASMLRSWDWYLSLRPTKVRRTEILAAGGGGLRGRTGRRNGVLGEAGGASLFSRNGYAASAWSEREPGSQCRKKGGPSVAARPTREAQWESVLRIII